MTTSVGPDTKKRQRVKNPSEEFSAYCVAEFERRLNSGQAFDQTLYHKAMAMVLDRLDRLETEGRLYDHR